MKTSHGRIVAAFCGAALAYVVSMLFVTTIGLSAGTDATVTVNWNKVVGLSKTSATLQVVGLPLLRRSSAIHDRLFQDLHGLGADYVRYIPWYPYPKLAIAELDPPQGGKTSWDFSDIDPMMIDFMHAVAGHPVVLNFSAIPQWMFKTKKPVPYPSDPDQVDWDYEQGTELRDPSLKEVSDYYARLVSWYTRGGFADEYGKWHASNYRYTFNYWEVLNEVEDEHGMTPKSYTDFYDAVVLAISKVAPRTKFMGLALEGTSPAQALDYDDPAFFQYFLNPKNHRPGVRLDAISYHFYANVFSDNPPKVWQFSFFDQADHFLDVVRYVETIRKMLSPKTQTNVDEIGTSFGYPTDNVEPRSPIPDFYWNLSGALYAYVYARLAQLGVAVAGESQFTGFPGQFPSCSMVDWNTGQPNARFWVLKLIRDNFGPGDKLVDTRLVFPSINNQGSSVYAQGFVTSDGTRKVLLINKRDKPFGITIPGGTGSGEEVVDQTTGLHPPRDGRLDHDSITLSGFAVAVVTLH